LPSLIFLFVLFFLLLRKVFYLLTFSSFDFADIPTATRIISFFHDLVLSGLFGVLEVFRFEISVPLPYSTDVLCRILPSVLVVDR